MALFMNRLGRTLSPRFLHADQFLAGLDPDANPVVCQTSSYSPTAPQRAFVHGQLYLFPAGALTVGLRVTEAECLLVAQITNRNPDGENPETAAPSVAPARRR